VVTCPDVELRVESSVGKIAAPITFTAVVRPNIRNNVESCLFSYGDGSRIHQSFDFSATHAYRKPGM